MPAFEIKQASDVSTLFAKILDVNLDDASIESTLSGFVYAGFDPLAMWTKIGSNPTFDEKEIALLMCACFQKGFGLKKFKIKVLSDDAANAIDKIIIKYGVQPNPKKSDDPTLQRIVSTSGFVAFRCYQHVQEKKRLNLAVSASEAGLKCPDVVSFSFMNSIMGKIVTGSIWEPIAILSEFMQGAITMKTMSEPNRLKQGIKSLPDAILVNRQFNDAARATPFLPVKTQQDEVVSYFITNDYNFKRTTATAVSTKLIEDLIFIHTNVFSSDFRAKYEPLGPIGEKMKNTAQGSLRFDQTDFVMSS